jgi:hypothetical protein
VCWQRGGVLGGSRAGRRSLQAHGAGWWLRARIGSGAEEAERGTGDAVGQARSRAARSGRRGWSELGELRELGAGESKQGGGLARGAGGGLACWSKGGQGTRDEAELRARRGCAERQRSVHRGVSEQGLGELGRANRGERERGVDLRRMGQL